MFVFGVYDENRVLFLGLDYGLDFGLMVFFIVLLSFILGVDFLWFGLLLSRLGFFWFLDCKF